MTQQLLKPNTHRRNSSEPLPTLPRSYRIPSSPCIENPGLPAVFTEPIYLSVVLPTFKERTNLLGMVTALSYLLDETLPNAYELIVVDDNSPDQTWKVALELSYHYPALRVIRRMGERGLATAVVHGWESARGQVLGVIDTDFQQPPEVLLELLTQIQQGSDLAVASRHAQGGGSRNLSLVRRVLSFGARLLGWIIIPTVVSRVSDPTSGYFLVRRDAIAERMLFPSGCKILLEVLSRGDIQSIAEVGYIFYGRREKGKNAIGSKVIGYVQHLLQLRQALNRSGLS